MTPFDELADKIGYAELNSCSELGFFFHGYLANTIGAILNDGLRVDCNEPCFSLNPASALLKYANPGLNSNNVYSGKVWDQIAGLAEGNLIPFTDDRDALLQRAIDYWRTDPSSGAALIIDLSGYKINHVKKGSITLNGQTIEGGISKWIYAHLTIEPEGGEPVSRVNPGRIAGHMLPSDRWASLFEQYHPVKHHKIPALENGRIQVKSLLDSEDCYIRARNNYEDGMIAHSIMHGTAMGLLLQELRKALLGMMAAKGIRILKNDFLPACEWPVMDPDETGRMMERLDSTRYIDTNLNAIKSYWLSEIHHFMKAGV